MVANMTCRPFCIVQCIFSGAPVIYFSWTWLDNLKKNCLNWTLKRNDILSVSTCWAWSGNVLLQRLKGFHRGKLANISVSFSKLVTSSLRASLNCFLSGGKFKSNVCVIKLYWWWVNIDIVINHGSWRAKPSMERIMTDPTGNHRSPNTYR